MKTVNLLKRIDGNYPEHDMCSCDECDWKGKVSDCESETEQDCIDGMPCGQSYLIHFCPKCEDGGMIDNYWSSRKAIFIWWLKEKIRIFKANM